jgi:Tfp pilus assembly protein PilE
MRLHDRHQPLNAGVTLIELMVAVTTAAVIALVTVQLFKVAILTYQATARQTVMLGAMRGALAGKGSRGGILEAARQAKQVQALDEDDAVFLSTSGATSEFTLASAGLTLTAGGVTTTLGDTISSMTVTYYNLNSSGLIIESTSAAGASFVTAMVVMPSAGLNQKTYRAFAGARLRNR